MIWVGRLISLAIILQTFELFWVKPFTASLVDVEAPKVLRWIFKIDRPALVIRLASAVAALAYPCAGVVAVLLLTTWMIAFRWRGTFNGGSDIMTFHILAAWLVSLCWPDFERACLAYIAVQLVLSYFVAGAAKIRNRDWRDGSAARVFLSRWGFQVRPKAALALSWAAMLFEISFPLAIFVPWPYLVLGMSFHLANTYVFGLNRFFFVWLAAYPALIAFAVQ